MTGGGSLVKGLSQRIMDRIGIDVKVSEEAISAVVKGTGKALSWISKLESDNQSYEDARRQILEEKQRLRRSY
ncbi:rod shape-determining protein [Citroniella saccharovorans]|uniref:Rod shape-determining protein n=3 Tax=Citroniella saccharovorans TaxID=2053367 RepID=A0AAW9MZJ9_9FIRM|nr:rod shape-determining protein [Citroniella saccharovorans]MEB3429967.1 rod shape-determining protein [Citroniella saccharovorans]